MYVDRKRDYFNYMYIFFKINANTLPESILTLG